MNANSTLVIAEIQSDIRAIEENEALCDEINFVDRAEAIDFIDFHIIDRIEGLQQETSLNKKKAILKQQAEKVKYELEKIDANLFKDIREKIRTGIYTQSSFLKMIREYVGSYFNDIEKQDEIGYDHLDDFINGLLFDHSIPEATIERKPEMVFYQKTPARIIFEMAVFAKFTKDDLFFDVGSGLGQAAILVNLISGVTTKGIEYEPAFCNYAQACTLQLNLSNVEFINADAREADYSEGTIFFMYTPFEGCMLQEMLDTLQEESKKRTIGIFTYGHCSQHVARQHWLHCVHGDGNNHYKLYEFRSLAMEDNKRSSK